MHLEVREVEEERAVLVAADEIHGFVGEEIAQVGALRISDFRVGDEIEMHAHRDDGFIEAASARMMFGVFAEVPFAEHAGGVAGLFEGLSDGDFVERQFLHVVHRPQWPALPVEAVDVADGVDAGARPVLAAHQRRTRGLAIRAGVGAGEFHPLRRHAVDVGRLVILAPETGNVCVAEIIGQDKDDIGILRLDRAGRPAAEHAQKSSEEDTIESCATNEPCRGDPGSKSGLRARICEEPGSLAAPASTRRFMSFPLE